MTLPKAGLWTIRVYTFERGTPGASTVVRVTETSTTSDTNSDSGSAAAAMLLGLVLGAVVGVLVGRRSIWQVAA